MNHPTKILAASAALGLLAVLPLAAYDPETDPTFVVKTSPVVLTAGESSEVVLIEGTNLETPAGGAPLVIQDLGQGSSSTKITVP